MSLSSGLARPDRDLELGVGADDERVVEREEHGRLVGFGQALVGPALHLTAAVPDLLQRLDPVLPVDHVEVAVAVADDRGTELFHVKARGQLVHPGLVEVALRQG